MDKRTIDKIKIARRCMNFTGIKCNNKTCTNKYCPLNVVYDSQNTGENRMSFTLSSINSQQPKKLLNSIRSNNLINEIDKIANLELSLKYRIILIKQIIEDWRTC